MKLLTFQAFQDGMAAFKNKADETYMAIGEGSLYTLKKQAVAETGYASTYQLFSTDGDGHDTAVGSKINIPEDYLVKNVELKVVITADTPISGYEVGDYYIDFTINTVDSSATASHIYLNVQDLVDEYTEGNGIAIDLSNAISIAIDPDNAHGLSVGVSGLGIDLATSLSDGAMSKGDKEKLDAMLYITQEESDEMIDNLFAAESGSYTLLKSGSDVNSIIRGLISDDYYYNITDVKNFRFSDTLDITPQSKNTISTNDSPIPAYAWIDGSNGDLCFYTEADKYRLNSNSSEFFMDLKGLTSLNLSRFDTSKVTNMSEMFGGCRGLESLNISSFKTSKVTDMSDMFNSCVALASLTVGSGFDTSKATTMKGMFFACNALANPSVIEGLDTGNVTDMQEMFGECEALTSLDLTGYDTSKVTNMKGMFSYSSNLVTLDLSSFNTSSCTSFFRMFGNCTKLHTIYASSGFTTDGYTSEPQYPYLKYMFNGCSALVGGAGTAFSSDKSDMARIDNPPSAPGYFTAKS